MIIIVMGVPCAGKSTFIKNNFSDFVKIDLLDYQTYTFSNYDSIWKSYEDCKDALLKAIKENENVVLEHTLLKGIRRKYYLDAIREVTDEDVIVYVINPSSEQILENAKKREVFSFMDKIEHEKSVLEIPTTEEGFKEVIVITENK